MNGYQFILKRLESTQRAQVDLFTPGPCVPPIESENARYKCPEDSPKSRTCRCGKVSGTLNDLQADFIKQFLQTTNSKTRLPLWHLPDLPNFRNKPLLKSYLLKPLALWHPEKQFGVDINEKRCPECRTGTLIFKQWSIPRHFHDMTTDAYFVYSIYRCRNCKKNYNSIDFDDSIVPIDVMLQCPVVLFHKTGVSAQLASIAFDIIIKRGSISTVSSTLASQRMATYTKAAALWLGHIESYRNKTNRYFGPSLTQQSEELEYEDFPNVFSHCNGYNGTLGPSNDFFSDLFVAMVHQQEGFYKRYIGGVIDQKITADHTHQIPSRFKLEDKTTGTLTKPINGLHGIMTGKLQIASLICTTSTSAMERVDQAQELRERYNTRNMELICAYLDKCCEDKRWLEGAFPDTCICLDNAHLIARYKEACGGTCSADKAHFLREISEAIVGKGERVVMEPGPNIFEKITQIISRWKRFESTKLEKDRVVNPDVEKAHLTQQKHFLHCLTPPSNFEHFVYDRFGMHRVRRGSQTLESFWRYLRAVLPETCSVELGLAILLATTIQYNFYREVQFDPEWCYLPISAQHVILTQHIVLHRSKFHVQKGEGTVSGLFRILPLSLHNAEEVFGIPPSFHNAQPKIIQVSPQVTRMAEYILSNVAFDTTLLDPTMEVLLAEAATNILEKNKDMDSQQLMTELQEQLPTLANSENTVSRYRLRVANSNIGHSTSKSRRKQAKRKHGSMKLGSVKMAIKESLKVFEKDAEKLSPDLNPFERRCLIYFVKKVVACQPNGPPCAKLHELDFASYPFSALHRLWMLFYSALVPSTHELASYVRFKSEQILKDNLISIVSFFRCRFEIDYRASTKVILKAFQRAYDGLIQEPRFAPERTLILVDNQIDTLENRPFIPEENSSICENEPEVLSNEDAANTALPISNAEDLVKNPFTIVDKCKNHTTSRVNWTAVSHEWLGAEFSHEACKQLKNRYFNRKYHRKREKPDDADETQAASKKVVISYQTQAIAVEKVDAPMEQLEVLERHPVLRCPLNCGIIVPSALNVMPRLADIDSVHLPSPQSGVKFNYQEDALLAHILTCEIARVKKGKNICWDKVRQRWIHWGKIFSIVTTRHSLEDIIWDRSQAQLKQKVKDNLKRSRAADNRASE